MYIPHSIPRLTGERVRLNVHVCGEGERKEEREGGREGGRKRGREEEREGEREGDWSREGGRLVQGGREGGIINIQTII